MTTVKELIEKLSKEDPNRIVILQRDPEGNGFSPMDDEVFTGAYDEHEMRIGIEKLTRSLRGQGFTKEDVIEGGSPALIITPMF